MRIVFDTELKRPGCVLLQAAMGGTIGVSEFQLMFPSETWLLAPTKNMGVFKVTEDQLEVLAEMAKEAVR